MTVLHLFDFFLPQTMNWAWRLLHATPVDRRWVAAPWMVRNQYFDPSTCKMFVHPFQEKTGWLPGSEWQAEWFSTNFVRAEKRWPLYRNWLERQLGQERPTVLHAHFAPVGWHYIPLAQRLGIPLVVSFYGFDYESVPHKNPVWKARYRQLFRAAACILCTGDFARQTLLQQGCPAETIVVLPLSIHPQEFPFFQREKKPNRLRLVQVATVTEKKGHLDTLEALRLALPNCPDLHLTLAGEMQDHSLGKKIHKFIKINHLLNNVDWQNFIPHDALPGIFSQAEVFIHPSRYAANRDSEGLPVVILEAQAMGLPVISTTHFDIPMEVLHGQTGLLAPERDPVMLAKHIARFYAMDNEEYQQFSRNAHAHVAAHFDVANTGQKLLGIYQEVAKSKPKLTA